MSAIIDLYNQVISNTNDISAQIQKAKDEITDLSSSASEDLSARIANLEEQLVKIDDYLLKIKGFQENAKKYLDSQNVLTIEAPPGYRVNLNRIRNWSMMIDPTSSNDPYAQRVLIVTECDKLFLNKKASEFKERIEDLKAQQASGTNHRIQELEELINQLQDTLSKYAQGEEFASFAREVTAENDKYWYRSSPNAFKNVGQMTDLIYPGALAADLPFDKNQATWLKAMLGDYYRENTGRVLIPTGIPNDREYVLSIRCPASRRKKLDRSLQNLVLSTINESPAGRRKLVILDGTRFNSASLGTLRELENSFVMEQIPRNPDQLTATLEKLVSSFADTDEILESYDSVTEYNANEGNNKKIPLSTIILFGWPSAFSGHDMEMIQRMMLNYERYGISFITVSYGSGEADSDLKAMPEYAMQNAIQINMLQKESTITYANSKSQRFVWYDFQGQTSKEFVDSVKKHEVPNSTLGSQYVNRVDIGALPNYTRGNKHLNLPFGIDSKDQMHSLKFDNENFAAFLMGASGSGKSTLLHTLITGIIGNYHPDDVELWLADFKMSEFAQYINPMPPHIKYILLDESKELVCDLIDKLTEKMMERQRYFMKKKHREEKKVENVPTETYMPIIFVILDEFSIMSQRIEESEEYKIKLQNLLAKGRSLGIKFIFSSQTYTSGVSGLTKTAKEQIQTRIAMKNSYNEVNETLELTSSSRTEQVKSWMEAFPPYYTLIKYRDGDVSLVKRFKAMYFAGKDDEVFKPQRDLIERVQAMKKINAEAYSGLSPDTYVDKKPVVIDGNSFNAFKTTSIINDIEEFKAENRDSLMDDDIIMSFGSPRRMAKAKFAVISNESRENLLLVTRGSEQSCGMSIILTAMRTFIMQGGKVHVWAYNKNGIYRTFKDSFASSGDLSEGISEVCCSIAEIREKIEHKEYGKDLIVMLGMEQICADFELFGAKNSSSLSSKMSQIDLGQYEASSEEELEVLNEVVEPYKIFCEEYKIEDLEDSMLDEGKSPEEINEEIDKLYNEFLEKNGMESLLSVDELSEPDEPVSVGADAGLEGIVPEEEDPAYNATEDFKYIVQQGSRFGYHFMLCLNDCSDLKATKLQQELFKHKMAFQISRDESIALLGSRIAAGLPSHVCQYCNALEQYSFRPFLHEGVLWDDWDIDESGNAINSEDV